MVLTSRRDVGEPEADIVTLTDADAPEMLALATLTEPGPFFTRTHTMGHFRGVRIEGRLAAMAGERMRFPGYTEVSGVCTHPDFRGRGLARLLSAAVVTGIQARGDQAFLHSWKSNQAAISLYEGLGFRIRTDMNVSVLRRADSL
jgi:predicted GNAT family acetyltransferase